MNRTAMRRGLTLLEISISVVVFTLLLSVIFGFLTQGTNALKTIALTMDLRVRTNEVLKQLNTEALESRRDFVATTTLDDVEQNVNFNGLKAFDSIVFASPRDVQGRFVIEGHVTQFQAAILYAPRLQSALVDGKKRWDLVRYVVATDPGSWDGDLAVSSIDAFNPLDLSVTTTDPKIELNQGTSISRIGGTVVLSGIEYFQVSNPDAAGPITIRLGMSEQQGRVYSSEDFQVSVMPGQ